MSCEQLGDQGNAPPADVVAQLVARFVGVRTLATTATALGSEARTRSSTFQTEGAIVAYEALRFFRNAPEAERTLLLAGLQKQGIRVTGTGRDEVEFVRAVLGPHAGQQRRSRVVSAVRELQALGVEDARAAIRGGGGVTKLAADWARRNPSREPDTTDAMRTGEDQANSRGAEDLLVPVTIRMTRMNADLFTKTESWILVGLRDASGSPVALTLVEMRFPNFIPQGEVLVPDDDVARERLLGTDVRRLTDDERELAQVHVIDNRIFRAAVPTEVIAQIPQDTPRAEDST
ncbi:hypothetical protein ACFQX4_21005 [Roseomonas sp. GCM10028921]